MGGKIYAELSVIYAVHRLCHGSTYSMNHIKQISNLCCDSGELVWYFNQ